MFCRSGFLYFLYSGPKRFNDTDMGAVDDFFDGGSCFHKCWILNPYPFQRPNQGRRSLRKISPPAEPDIIRLIYRFYLIFRAGFLLPSARCCLPQSASLCQASESRCLI